MVDASPDERSKVVAAKAKLDAELDGITGRINNGELTKDGELDVDKFAAEMARAGKGHSADLSRVLGPERSDILLDVEEEEATSKKKKGRSEPKP